MKESHYKSYDDLPLFLNAEMTARVMGVSPSSGYERMHELVFPVLCRRPHGGAKEQFIRWVSDHTGGGS